MKTKALRTSALALSLAAPAMAADTFVVDKGHSEVGFQATHLTISKVRGRFTDFAGEIQIDAAKPEASSVTLTIQTQSVDTNNADRDDDLRATDGGFFEVAKYPTITFKSTKVVPKGKDLYSVTGEFTMHGVTKMLTLPVKVVGPISDPWGNTRYAFETSTVLNRKEYGLTYNKLMDTGGLIASDEVTVNIQLEVKKKTQ